MSDPREEIEDEDQEEEYYEDQVYPESDANDQSVDLKNK
jgi:hypothetical protein